MNNKPAQRRLPHVAGAIATAVTLCTGSGAVAGIDGITGPTFNLTAKADYINSGDGNFHYMWSFANGNGRMQYPGPTMIVNQGETVTVTLNNELAVPVSLIFPGQSGVESPGCAATTGSSTGSGKQGAIACEAAAKVPPAVRSTDTVTYTFKASKPGTYMYQSGTNPALQVEMGLVGALIVRPAVENPLGQAYEHPATAFHREHLFVLTEIDPAIHFYMEFGVQPNLALRRSTLFFINGRNAPDTMLDSGSPWLPTQPYGSVARMHPGEKLLMRVVAAGQELHPLHHHGNNTWTIARDGRLLESTPGAGPDLAWSDFTIKSIPGQTVDAIYQWTGKNLGFDFYGHAPGDPLQPGECPNGIGAPDCDHGKPLPVALPNLADLTIGAHYSGSPYLGQFGTLPPGTTTQNLHAGYYHMVHSHTELELTNDGLFPGGMAAMIIVEHPGVPIP